MSVGKYPLLSPNGREKNNPMERNKQLFWDNLGVLEKDFKKKSLRLHSLPVMASFALHTASNYCNVNCKFCYFRFGGGPIGITNPKNFKFYFKALKPLFPYVEFMRFEYGEPLFHKFIKECYIKFLNGNYVGKPEIITNGTLLDKFWIKTIAKRFGRIQLSINAANPKTYMKLTGLPYRVHKKLIDDICKLVELKKKYSSTCEICISYIIVPENIEETLLFFKLMKKLGVDTIRIEPDMFLIQKIIRQKNKVQEAKKIIKSLIDIYDFFKIVPDQKGVEYNRLLGLLVRLGILSSRKSNITYDKICPYPWVRVYIHPSGVVTFCPYLGSKYALGNILEGNIIHMWNSQKAAKIRNEFKNMKPSDKCITGCSCMEGRDFSKISYLIPVTYDKIYNSDE